MGYEKSYDKLVKNNAEKFVKAIKGRTFPQIMSDESIDKNWIHLVFEHIYPYRNYKQCKFSKELLKRLKQWTIYNLKLELKELNKKKRKIERKLKNLVKE